MRPDIPGFHFPVNAGDLQLRVEAEEGIASPGFVCLCGFQQIAMGGYIFRIFKVSIGVVKSERSSQLTGSTLY